MCVKCQQYVIAAGISEHEINRFSTYCKIYGYNSYYKTSLNTF